MQLLVIAVACLIQFASLAQQPARKPAARPPETKNTSKAKAEEIFYSPVADLRYSGGYALARPAGLYRSLADARRGRPAYWLQTEARVFAADDYPTTPGWRRVARDTYLRSAGPEPGVDTTVYYLRSTALSSKTRPPKLFTLH